LDTSYWIKRLLHRLSRRSLRFVPSIHFCENCNHHVQINHFEKSPNHIIRSFGWKYRKPSPAAKSISRLLLGKVALPDYYSLVDEGLTPPVLDQGQEGSCTGHAFVAMKGSQELNAGDFPEGGLSRRYIYNGARALEGRLSEEGAYSEDLFIVAKDGLGSIPPGLCREETWPYVNFVDSAKWPPSKTAQDEAPDWKILEYAVLNRSGEDAVENIRQTIYQMKEAVYIGVPWPYSWMEPKSDGTLPVPGSGDSVAGGHAVAIVGFKHSARLFLLQNSWGKWGPLKGYAWAPYEAIPWWEMRGGWDCYKSTDAPSPKPPEPKTCAEQRDACLESAETFADQIGCIIEWIVCELRQLGWITSKKPTATFAKKCREATITISKLRKRKRSR
jgi:hypothetical protein